jgi:thioredoxin reductase (NADPH)
MGRGVEHFVTDPQEFRGRRVAVVGGGDSAVDWSLLLEPIAESVVLVHRRDAFTAHPYSLELLGRSGVEVITPAQITGLGGDAGLEWLEVTRTEAAADRRPVDAIVAALGFTANLGPLLEWGIEIESRRYVTVDTTMRSSIEGIYAAGDIAGYPGKVRLISVGFGEAATAVNNAVHQLHPEQDLFPGHSTDQMPSLATAGGTR